MKKYKDDLKPGAVLELRARCSKDQRTEGNRLTVSTVKPLKPKKARDPDAATRIIRDAEPEKPKEIKPLVLRLNSRQHSAIDLERIHEVITQHPGEIPVHLIFSYNGGSKVRFEMGPEFRIEQTKDLIQSLLAWM